MAIKALIKSNPLKLNFIKAKNLSDNSVETEIVKKNMKAIN